METRLIGRTRRISPFEIEKEHGTVCVVCGSDDLIASRRTDFNRVCHDHWDLAGMLQIDLWLMQINARHFVNPFRLHDKSSLVRQPIECCCEICDEVLTIAEYHAIHHMNDVIITCGRHRPFAQLYDNTARLLFQIGKLPEDIVKYKAIDFAPNNEYSPDYLKIKDSIRHFTAPDFHTPNRFKYLEIHILSE